ncbi:hypothetical protein ACQ86K_09900 [Mucilaginibacter sp. P19]
MADEQQLEQAFINIVKNAIEAIDDQGSVTFTINLKEKSSLSLIPAKVSQPNKMPTCLLPSSAPKKTGRG